MDIQALSSNWKNLQDKIKHDKSKPLKRKAPAEDHDRHWESRVKRYKVEKTRILEKSSQKQKLGSVTLPANKEPAPSASLALWAEDNDISAADLAQAYGTPMNSSSTPETYEDRVNEGLSKTYVLFMPLSQTVLLIQTLIASK